MFDYPEIALQMVIDPEPIKISTYRTFTTSSRETQRSNSLKSRKDYFCVCFSTEPNINFRRKRNKRQKGKRNNYYHRESLDCP